MIEWLIWIFTARCNLACRHCYVLPRFSKLLELDLGEKLRLTEEAWEVGVNHIGLSGGEPLVHPHFEPIVKQCYDLGISLSTVTNGVTVNERIATLLSRYDIYTIVSLDGGSKSVHEKIRGEGSWGKVIEGIGILRNAGVEFATVMAVNPVNYREAADFVELSAKLGAERACLIPVMKTGAAARMPLAIKWKEYMEAIKLATAKAEELGYPVSLWCTPFVPIITKSPYVGYWQCRQRAVMDIDPSGRVLLCDVLDVVVTSVKNRGLAAAIAEFESHPLVEKVTYPVLSEPCTKCEFSKECMGGCFARAFLEYGKLDAPDPLCPRVGRLKER